MKIRITIRDKDIKIRKKQALPSKPFKNKKLYNRRFARSVGLKSIRQTSGISKLS